MMDLDNTLKFFNRIGVRVVNDVTAHVTAKVTADMDPEGMGAHAGPLPLALVPAMATKNELLVAFADISKVMGNALVTSSKTVHDSALNVIVHKVGEMKQYVDDKVAGIDDKVAGIDDKMVDIDDKMVDPPCPGTYPSRTADTTGGKPSLKSLDTRVHTRPSMRRSRGYSSSAKSS